jgi:hypothetical protein
MCANVWSFPARRAGWPNLLVLAFRAAAGRSGKAPIANESRHQSRHVRPTLRRWRPPRPTGPPAPTGAPTKLNVANGATTYGPPPGRIQRGAHSGDCEVLDPSRAPHLHQLVSFVAIEVHDHDARQLAGHQAPSIWPELPAPLAELFDRRKPLLGSLPPDTGLFLHASLPRPGVRRSPFWLPKYANRTATTGGTAPRRRRAIRNQQFRPDHRKVCQLFKCHHSVHAFVARRRPPGRCPVLRM